MKTAPLPGQTGFDPVRLIEQHQAGIWRYLRALGCDPSLAEDLTQDVFVAVLQRPFKDYSPAATAAYLRRTAFNMFITVQRRAGRVINMENLDQVDTEWSQLAANDNGEALLDALRECLEGLTERARRALRMRFEDRESRSNIAASLNISEHGAKNLMQRAKRQLRQCVEGKME
jgi:RNA polymerase sigma-70 factor (ECF subfamily)